MSGDITDLPIRLCPSCGLVFVEDDRMYTDTTVCPRCGAEMADEAVREEPYYE